LSKNPEPGPYPRQNVFDYIERRGGLSAQQRTEANLHELEIEVQQHPDRPRSLYLLAEADLKLNHVSEAMQILDRLDKISERDFRTLLGEGVLLAGFQLYPAAIEHFQAALAANPSSDEAAYDLANAYFQNHDDSKALQSLQQVSVDAKNDGAYLALLGDVYMRLGRTGDAAQVLRKAILTSPDNDEYYLSLALAQLHAGDTGDAYMTLQRGLARVPDSGILHWGAGVTSVVQGDARRGETYLKKAVELAPRESAFMTLGVFYYEAGRINEAREVLRRCSEMFPKGSVDVAGIGATLDAASVTRTSAAQVAELPPHARQEFYQIALQLAERDR
jgi:tetratricopeptide (TPR) repeat protein